MHSKHQMRGFVEKIESNKHQLEYKDTHVLVFTLNIKVMPDCSAKVSILR